MHHGDRDWLASGVDQLLDLAKTKLELRLVAGLVTKLDRFVLGKRLTVSTPDLGNGQGDVKGLKGYNDELFEIRFYDVAPQQRMLGVFPMKDVFLGFGIFDRGEIGKDWNRNCQRVQKRIEAMGKSKPPCLSHRNMEAVLSNWSESK